MTPTYRAIEESNSSQGAPHVRKQDIRFLMRVLSHKGKPVDLENFPPTELLKLEERVFLELPDAVSGWTYVDHEKIEYERFDCYHPEYSTEGETSNEVALWEVAVGCSQAVPLLSEDTDEGFHVSVEQLMAEVPPKLKELAESNGLQVELYAVRWYKEYQYVETGEYRLK